MHSGEEASKMQKTPKTLLDEVLAKRKPFGAKLKYESEPIGDGRFSCLCTFVREADVNIPVLTGKGEGQGKRNAEHAAARDVLEQMDIHCEYESPVQSPQRGVPIVEPGPSGSINGNPGRAGNVSQLDLPQHGNPHLPRTMSDQDWAELVTSTDKNYVGMLQEYCAKKKIGEPKYSKEIPDNPLMFKTSCTAAGITKSGEEKKVAISKKIAAAKIVKELGLDSDGTKVDGGVSVEQLAEALQSVSVNSPSREGIKTPPVLRQVPLVPVPTVGNGVQISDTIWYFPDKKLGSGGFGTVYKGYKEVPTCRVAVKQIRKEVALDPKNKELQILRHIKHENLINYSVSAEKDGFVYIVMELAQSTLEEWITKESHGYETLVKICKDTALGLKELHRLNVVHRDIKPNNVLIFLEQTTAGVTPKAKLTDFGISRVIDESSGGAHTTAGILGTMSYMPPEAKPHMKLKPSFDIFQLGLLFTYTMTRGDHLFASPGKTEPHQIQAKIIDDQPNWSVVGDRQLSPLKNILQVMVSHNPERRSEMRVLLEHPFFWNYKETLEFIVAVSNDSKNKGTCNSAVSAAAQVYLKDMPDWKVRLDKRIIKWMAEKDKSMEEAKKGSPLQIGWRKYSGTSIIQLINFIRDQQQHNSNWIRTDLVAEDVFGRDGRNYGAYFIKTFPELVTLLYNVLQDPKFQGPETTKYFEKNTANCFSLV